MKKTTRTPLRPSRPPERRSTPPDATDGDGSARYQFQLYITGTSPRSTQAVANLRALCEEHLAGNYDLEVIDLYQEPSRASGGQIIASPTLVKMLPRPLLRMVGNLANREQLLIKLDLARPGDDHSSPLTSS